MKFLSFIVHIFKKVDTETSKIVHKDTQNVWDTPVC